MRKVGERIGAILSGKDGVIEFLGFGVYVGDEVPPADAKGWMAVVLHEAGQSNPRLDLDNGDTVWGCQCWWGSEAQVKKQIEGQNINHVRIGDIEEKS